jgi:taurine dioxygenase
MASSSSSSSFAINPLSDVLGAEVVGLDTGGPVPDADLARVEDALNRHGVLVFRDQRVTPAQHVAFSRRFGELMIHVQQKFRHKEHPEILIVSNVIENGEPIGLVDAGRYWHSDISYVPEPSLGSLLHAQELPEEGGDTIFASMTAAYDALDEATKERIDGLTAVHDYDARNRKQNAKDALRPALSEEQRRTVPPTEHPVVRVHPGSGRKALFVSEGFTTHIVGLPPEEGDALLARLFEHQTRPEFCYRHVWRPGDMVFWDNRSTMHLATGCPPHLRRTMYRTTVKGDRPVGPARAAGAS